MKKNNKRDFNYFNEFSTWMLKYWIRFYKKDIKEARKDPSVNIKGLKSDLKYIIEVVESREKMDWEVLKEIARYHNIDDQKGLREYLEPIINEIKEGQILDIIITSISLAEEDFFNNIQFYRKLHSHTKDMLSSNMREAIRLGRLDQLIDKYKDIN